MRPLDEGRRMASVLKFLSAELGGSLAKKFSFVL
jgi:hypothetical protein